MEITINVAMLKFTKEEDVKLELFLFFVGL